MPHLNQKAFLTLFLAVTLVVTPFFGVGARTPNDPLYTHQWYLSAIGAEAAWNTTTGSRNVIVAVIDTAIDIDHEDLKANIWQNTDEVFGNAIDDDKNGFVDDVYGWNFEASSWDVRPHADIGDEIGYIHGTAVASLIGAKGNNGVGMSGVAWDIQLMPVVALDAEGNGSVQHVASAIRYAVDNGAQIINLSLEGYTNIPVVEDALVYAQQHGVLTVAAAGNAATQEGLSLDDVAVFPACLSLEAQYGVFGVGSVDQDKRKAAFANYGSCILVSAPGEDMFGAQPLTVHDGSEQSTYPGYTEGLSGTSLATPLVSGAAALLKSLRPDWGWAELREWLMASAAPIDHLQEVGLRNKIGRGLLDISTAVAGVPNPVTAATEPSPSPASVAVDAAQKLLAHHHTFRVAVGDGFIVAESKGGRAWGVEADGKTTLFYPYGQTYRAGLNAVAIPGGIAFAPKGGGGHLMVTDLIGRRLVSAFPFGKEARGSWSVSVTPPTQGVLAELVMTGPSGSRAIPLDRIGAEGWRVLP